MAQPKSDQAITISPISALSDNYIWAISQNNNNHLALVDPGNADVCLDYISQHNKKLTTILITHHHIDHVGGIDKLLSFCQAKGWQTTVYSPAFNPLPNQENLAIPLKHHKHTDIVVQPGDEITLAGFMLKLKVIDVSGHTLEHIAYHNEQLLFCGDALFSGGCGRRFEGSAKQMHKALLKLENLPEQVKVYCAHEYTLANLSFALKVEPNNEELKKYRQQVEKIRAQGKSSLPSTIALEKKINPFLRTNLTSVCQSVSHFANKELNNATDVFDYLRQWKDQ